MGVFLFLLFSFPPVLTISNMFHAPIESIPIDSGWIGLALTLVDGLLLSYVIARDGVDTTERLLLSIGLGFGLTFAGMILIGVLWEINILTVALTQLILLIALGTAAVSRGLRPNFNFLKVIKTRRMPQLSVLAAVALIVISIYSIAAIYRTASLPATEWDSLAYGVNYAKIIFEKRGIPLIAGPSLGLEMSANYPPGVQLTAAYLYVLAGNANDFYFRVLSPIFGLATMVAAFRFAIISSRNKTAAIFAVFTLSALPFFWELFVQETYLMGLTYMLTLSALFFFKAYDSKSGEAQKYELLGTLLCCFSALTSYIGLFSFGLLLLYALNAKINLKRFTHLTALALLVTVPWYARNLILLGNPIYPFFGIGKYLEPLLRNSTVQHFQNYTTIPLFFWISIFCKLGAGILVIVIAYLSFSKRKNLLRILPSYLQKNLVNNIPSSLQKNFLIILPSYLFLVAITIMALHIPFPRYIIIALPCSVVIFSATVKSFLAMHNFARVIAVILISVIAISSAFILPYMNSSKPTARLGDDKWDYLTQVFEEGDAWTWINKNTPTDARIATYDIKEYYIERDVMPLDGNESAPLYKIDSIAEAMDFLHEKRITHVLSVPWTSPTDPRMLNAYELCVLTRYLGDLRYLPPVYVGQNGTTVYHVGSIDEKTIYDSFAQKEFAPPIKQVTINLSVTNNTYPYLGKLYVPVPADYREGLMVFSIDSCQLVDIELWTGLIPAEMITNPLGGFMFVKKWSTESSNSSGVENPSFEWQIDRAGYFTFRIVDKEETFTDNFNITLDLRFYNYWELKSP